MLNISPGADSSGSSQIRFEETGSQPFLLSNIDVRFSVGLQAYESRDERVRHPGYREQRVLAGEPRILLQEFLHHDAGCHWG